LWNQDTCVKFFNSALEKAKSIDGGGNSLKYLPNGVLFELILSFADSLMIRDLKHVKRGSNDALELEFKNNTIIFSFSMKASLFPELEVDYDFVSFLAGAFQVDENSKTTDDDSDDVFQRQLYLKTFSEKLGIKPSLHELESKRILSQADIALICKYMKACKLFLLCLGLASVSERISTENQLLATIPMVTNV